jgi:hypothetical protein
MEATTAMEACDLTVHAPAVEAVEAGSTAENRSTTTEAGPAMRDRTAMHRGPAVKG